MKWFLIGQDCESPLVCYVDFYTESIDILPFLSLSHFKEEGYWAIGCGWLFFSFNLLGDCK